MILLCKFRIFLHVICFLDSIGWSKWRSRDRIFPLNRIFVSSQGFGAISGKSCRCATYFYRSKIPNASVCGISIEIIPNLGEVPFFRIPKVFFERMSEVKEMRDGHI